MLAPREVPVSRSRAEGFEALVVEAVLRLQRRLPDQLRAVDFAVQDVPPHEDGAGVPLGGSFPAEGDRPARVVVYRRPVDTRATSERVRALLVNDVVVEQVAALLGIDPDAVDPDYGTGYGTDYGSENGTD